ncbi:MAG: hypothetical protein HYX83_00780 [Chloroflexi bacterium]|nr:hypothetical protein [Chloroflexota bacterium]
MGNNFTWEVLNPGAEREILAGTTAPRVPDLTGKKVGLFSNGKPGVLVVLDIVSKLIKERFTNIEFELFELWPGVADDKIYRRLADCDAVVAAIGD